MDARPEPTPSALRPSHFFLLATLLLVTAAVVLLRDRQAPLLLLVAFTIGAGGYSAFALYRTLVPLAGGEVGEETVMVAGRTRVALERDKALTLRSIKELEFDHAMGKVADGDFAEMRERLRARAMRLIRQLDGAEAYRGQIERDLATLAPAAPAAPVSAASRPAPADPAETARIACAACGTSNDPDARFCTRCGSTLRAPAAPVCAECGTTNEADARFCKMCGHALGVPA